MPYLQSNIPQFKCWVRREYTCNHLRYHGEFLHAMAVAVTTMPNRCLSFQVIFTGCETDDTDESNVHGGAMWARMPITALMSDIPVEEWPEPMEVHDAQPWDCSSHTHAVYTMDRATPCPWLAKIGGEMYPAKYLFTVDYSESEIADDPAQHKQSHVMYLLDAGIWTGNIVALPNNRVRVTHPAWFETGEGAPDFLPSQHIHYSKSNLDYTLDVNKVFDNLYNESTDGTKKKGAGMTKKGIAKYRRDNPGSKLKGAVTGKVKKGSKAANRRKSYCARSAGQMKKFPKAAKDPNSRLRQARKRWKC